MNIRRIYQVLIVDDEEYILQSVSALLESDRRFELELFHAQSVNAAISIMQRRRIDILITDIQMPSCSGIHLAHVVHERWPDCKTLVFTAHADFQLARDTIHEGVISYSQRVLTRVMQYVENNIAGDLSLATLSRIACYNASYLSRLFMEKKGVTLSNYIAQRRMEYIQLWLADETITLNEIAVRTGFESRSYFNRFVKRMTGISPMQLRKNMLTQKSDTP